MFLRGQGQATRTAIALTTALALSASGCTQDRIDGDGDPIVAPSTVAPSAATPEVVVSDALAGANSVTATWVPSDAFRSSLAALDPTASDLAAAASGYDAVVIAALAAESARSDAPGRLAAAISSGTGVGEPCGNFTFCRRVALREDDFDYEGISGPLALDVFGIATQGSFQTTSVSPTGRLVPGETVGGQFRANDFSVTPTDPRAGALGDGVLRIATAIPGDSEATMAQRSALAGVRLAVNEINDPIVGGVVGSPIELLGDLTGAGSEAEYRSGAEAAVAQSADVMIGAVDQASAATLLGVLTPAAIPLISPLDVTPESLIEDPAGLYFRTTPTADLIGRVVGQTASYNGVTNAMVVTGSSGIDAVFTAAAVAALNEFEAGVATEVPLTDTDDPAAVAAMIAASAPTALVVASSLAVTEVLASELDLLGFGPASIPWFVAPWSLGTR